MHDGFVKSLVGGSWAHLDRTTGSCQKYCYKRLLSCLCYHDFWTLEYQTPRKDYYRKTCYIACGIFFHFSSLHQAKQKRFEMRKWINACLSIMYRFLTTHRNELVLRMQSKLARNIRWLRGLARYMQCFWGFNWWWRWGGQGGVEILGVSVPQLTWRGVSGEWSSTSQKFWGNFSK